ncbi:MAG: xanthine dehydrogenase family protein subunit M [Planctomycetes bacterium]|nr:xanthine dehydrogenase family protein subunit M [Planctomycetota bacterium]
MHLPNITLHDVDTLEQAADLATRLGPGSRFLAGGTDLLVDLKTGRVEATHLVSLNRIASLRKIEEDADGLRIGALTTITQLDREGVVRTHYEAICDATSQMAAPQIRNVATVGGNIMSAVPCADLPPILTAMNASVVVWSKSGERTIPLESFFVGVRATKLECGEVLTAVLVPEQPARFGAAYARFALREGNAIAVASVAAGLQMATDDTIRSARIVLGAVSPTPVLVESAGRLLAGRTANDESWEIAAREAIAASHPISDVRASAEFRREIVGIMAKRALRDALRRAQGGPS